MATATLGLLHPIPNDLELNLTEAGADQDINEDDKPFCRLLALPAEIRNQIYHLLLTSDILPVLRRLVCQNQLSSYVLPPLPICPAVLSTCKQIYQEASPILYSLNTFTASSTLLTSLPFLLSPARPVLCPKAGKKIKKWFLHVRLDVDCRFTEEDATSAFTGAEELEIDASQAMYKSSGMDALILFKEVRGVRKAMVTGSVERDFAQWLEECMMSPIGTSCPDFDKGGDSIVIGGMRERYNVWTHGNR